MAGTFDPGEVGFGGNLSSLGASGGITGFGGLSDIGNSFDFLGGLKDLGGFFGSESGKGLLGIGSLGLGAYGLNKSLGFQEDQLGLLQDQENRAATAQNFQTGNSLALQLQNTTPGTPEHARIKAAIAEGSFQV